MRALRSVPPVRSPITVSSIIAGVSAAISTSAGENARTRVEQLLQSRFGTTSILLTDSGTSALSLALRHSASRRGESRPVALPAYGCYDLATAVDSASVPFVLYDVDPLTLGPDWDSLREALKAGADRMVIVHLYGIPVDMRRVGVLAAEFDALVIEDAAQGAGASWEGSPLGSLGSLGILSFGRGKGMTGGHGGALLANHESAGALVAGIETLPDAGTSAVEGITFIAQWMMAGPLVYGIPASLPFLGLGETTYRGPGEARGPSRFSMGALSRTIELVDQETNHRRVNAGRLMSSLDGDRLRAVAVPSGGAAGFLRLPVVASAAASRAARQNDARRLGVMPGYPSSLASLNGFGSRRTNLQREMAGAECLAQRLITLPTHGALSETDISRLEDWSRMLEG